MIEVDGSGGQDIASAKKAGGGGPRDKRIEDSKRSTTPYMTKYERARVLGTRSLQIRWVSCFFSHGVPMKRWNHRRGGWGGRLGFAIESYLEMLGALRMRMRASALRGLIRSVNKC